jgi:hypothetical protein
MRSLITMQNVAGLLNLERDGFGEDAASGLFPHQRHVRSPRGQGKSGLVLGRGRALALPNVNVVVKIRGHIALTRAGQRGFSNSSETCLRQIGSDPHEWFCSRRI